MTDEKDLNQFDTTDLEDNVVTEKIHLTAKESARISRENRKITDAIEKQRNRKNVPESEYLTRCAIPITWLNLTIFTHISSLTLEL